MTQTGEPRAVTGQGVLDLTHMTSADELAAISRLEGVGAAVVPESLAGAFERIPRDGVGAVVYVPDGGKVRIHTGPLVVGGDGIGSADDVLVVIGMLIVTSPVTGPVPQRICVVGSVLAPWGSEHALGPALGGGVGSVSYYRYSEGQDFKVLAGQVKLSSAMLANPAGQPEDILIAAGQVVVTGQVSAVNFAQVIVAGQFVAPQASRDLLEPRVQAHGQVSWYRGDEARLIMEDTRFGPDFFRLLDHTVSLVVLADLMIEPGVTEAALREKVTDIVLFGDLTAPAELVPLLQVLAADAYGTIRADDGPGS
jgi:hypothetical protein